MIIIIKFTLLCIFAISLQGFAWSAELTHQFSSPSFSGIGWSSHVLTIEQMEAARSQKIKDENKAAQDKADRDAKNTNLAKFLVNVESRIYAQLSKQLANEARLLPKYSPASGITYYFSDDESRVILRKATTHIAEVTVPVDHDVIVNITQDGTAVTQQVNRGGTSVINIIQR